jgi:NAD(P)-dependent dehydrogenase (short-subunit alcohol dehydrogenase family)
MTKPVAIITGGAQGIGQACAERFAQNGYYAAILDRNRERAQETLDRIEAQGGQGSIWVVDVGKSLEVQSAVDHLIAERGRIDVLVNNAGIVYQKRMEQLSDEEWFHVLQTNLTGMFYTARAVIPQMRAQRQGRIINLSSVLSTVARPLNGPYATSKGGINAFTRALALELARDGTTVNAVAPGHILTPLTVPMFTRDVTKAFEDRIPLGYLGQPQWIADAVAFLASPQAQYITGQILYVDGGFNINGDLPHLEFGGQLD